MNKDGKINGKFNIIDILAIVLVLVVIVGIVWRFGSSVTTAVKSDSEFTYVVKVEGVRDYTIKALEKGGRVTDKNSTMDLGEIVDVAVMPATTISETATGNVISTELPGRYSAMITIKTYGKESDNSYIAADSNELSVGRTTNIFSKYVHTSGIIMSVEKQ